MLQRRIQWIDTDAAGIYHYTTTFRLCEEAEAILHDRLGVRDVTFGATPRVSLSARFHAPLRFFDLVEVELRVADVGRTSCREELTLRRDGVVAAEAELTVVLVDRATGRAVPWPDEVRQRLLHAGPQAPSTIT
ncbi:MAG TPA: thioesterase family protein [Nitriliruptorales bacterium]|nr:thioesterase family protein [Nitriliruptorales bacterium]